jgi:RES domain-containing protein
VAGTVLWRIARRAHALDRLGAGAREEGGRWNVAGTAIIYAGRSVGIAALEKFVHLAGLVPPDLVLVRIEVPAGTSSETPALADLPPGWNSLRPGPASMQFGTRWAQENRSLVLFVPSVIVPEETNAVLNPCHPEFGAIRMKIERAFHFDSRMLARRRVSRRPRRA